MSKRKSQDTAVNKARKLHGTMVIDRCGHCNNYLLTLCQATGDKIKYPISGGIPLNCPLPAAPEPA